MLLAVLCVALPAFRAALWLIALALTWLTIGSAGPDDAEDG
jgi:hypothetical protein